MNAQLKRYESSRAEMEAPAVLYRAVVGSRIALIELDGFAEGAEPLFYGYFTCSGPERYVRVGLCWDENRFVTFIGGDALSEEERGFLMEAGFTLPEGWE